MVWEDIFQVYQKRGESEELLASDMTIDNVCLFINAWFSDHFDDQATKIEIRRQPLNYGERIEKNE